MVLLAKAPVLQGQQSLKVYTLIKGYWSLWDSVLFQLLEKMERPWHSRVCGIPVSGPGF